MNNLRYIDLFAGAGGLSEGFIKAGFSPVAHVEMNKDACDTLKTRTAYYWLKENNQIDLYYDYLKSDEKNKEKLWDLVPSELINSVINQEISSDKLNTIFAQIDQILGNNKVDVIIGGPPCQAYSIVGRARDPNKMQNDPRNYLYLSYIEFLKKYKPKMFVFENVPGLFSAQNGKYFKDIIKGIQNIGYDLRFPGLKDETIDINTLKLKGSDKYTLNSKNFNVLQSRKRVIIIGWKKELNLEYPKFKEIIPKYELMKDLFSDLQTLQNGGGTMGAVKYAKKTTEYLELTKIRNGFDYVTQHIARPNNDNDLEIYRIAVDKWANGERLHYPDLPSRLIKHKNLDSFTNRFQVVNGKGISHTVVAHIAMDGHYYIHPDKKQNRSISVREAARIQSFPDDYFFEGSRSAAFKQIGNAVPPLMAKSA